MKIEEDFRSKVNSLPDEAGQGQKNINSSSVSSDFNFWLKKQLMFNFMLSEMGQGKH